MLKDKIQNPLIRNLVEWLLAILVAVFLFLIIRTFLFRMANVDGLSMEPTLKHRDLVILSSVTYIFSNPKPGDIVAFPYKEDPSEHYIKRVIGVPGDVINLVDSKFTVNGAPLDDAFSGSPIIYLGDIMFPITVEDGHYFVLGDNRNGSKDSRFAVIGNTSKDRIMGKAIARVWPFNKMKILRKDS